MTELWAILGALAAAVVGILGYGAAQRRKGREHERNEANAETLDRIEQGRRAVDRDGTPDERVRDNDGRW